MNSQVATRVPGDVIVKLYLQWKQQDYYQEFKQNYISQTYITPNRARDLYEQFERIELSQFMISKSCE